MYHKILEIEPKDEGTELRLEHTGFAGPKNILTSFIMEIGWRKIVNKKLKKAFETHLA